MSATHEADRTRPAARRRRVPRILGLLAAAILVAAGSYVGPSILGARTTSTGTSQTAPRGVLPAPGGAPVLGDAPAVDGRLSLPERIAFWSTRVQQQPSDFLSYIQLAVSWSEQGRLRSDIDAYQRASEAVDRALAISPAYPQALAVRASIRFATHDFAGAEADARTSLRSSPQDPASLATLGDAVLELGRIDEAAATYERLAAIAGGPSFDVRQARLAYVRGDRAAALEFARKALIGASGGGPDGAEASGPIELAFYHFALGEYARLSGDADLAGDQFMAALAIRPDDLGSLLGLARIDAYRGDLDAAIAGLMKATAIAPTPAAEGLLADLLVRRNGPGDADAARVADGTVRLTGRLSALAGSVYDRTLVLYDLDHGGAEPALVDRAEAALAVRPDAGGHDLLAWALHRVGRDAEAWTESRAALATGDADARTLFHAGAIAAALGDVDGARELLARAIELGPALDPVERAEASAVLAGLGAP